MQSASQAIVLQNGRACRLLEVMVSNVFEMAAEVGVPVIHPSAPHQRQHSALIIGQRAFQCLSRARAEEQIKVQGSAVVDAPRLHPDRLVLLKPH